MFEFMEHVRESDYVSADPRPDPAIIRKKQREGKVFSFGRRTISYDLSLYIFGVGANLEIPGHEQTVVPYVLMQGATGCLFFVDVTTEISHGYFEEVNRTYISQSKMLLLIVATHATTQADLTRVSKALETDAPVIPFDPASEKSARYVLAEALKHYSRWRHTQLQRSIEAAEFAINWYNSLT
ncbi:MAG: hypothetical protein AAFU54_24460 [Chloroflexota bacterium]